jgi:hypothetical protein
MIEPVIVPSRFRGPPNSGNGGYVAGTVAERFPLRPDTSGEVAVEVTLRAPIPLDAPLLVECSEESHLRLTIDGQLIAEAAPTRLIIDIPTPPALAAAEAARPRSPALQARINDLIPNGTGFHPVCVCCGADVPEGEGLRVFAAPVPGFDGVAAAWHPHPAFADADGLLPERMIWTALDCPGQFAYLAAGIRTGLLGRMTARVLRPVPVDADYLVIGWRQEVERRKHFAGTALFDADANLCAYSRQTWIGRMD